MTRKASILNKILCRLIGHRRQSVEIEGEQFGEGRYFVAHVIDTHVSCARCGKFIEYS